MSNSFCKDIINIISQDIIKNDSLLRWVPFIKATLGAVAFDYFSVIRTYSRK